MTPQSERVLPEALERTPIDRAELVEEILPSFDFPARKEIGVIWAREAESRLDAYERGHINAVSAEQVFDG